MTYSELEMRAYEAFIRRAAALDFPFMLKGSYVTRQYFAQPTDRTPQDLDWVYTGRIGSPAEAKTVFDDWATRVTELAQDDGVVFQSFQKNAFWRMIDYAMADDFPTINTDLECWVDGEHFENFTLDISFNLPLELPSEPLIYQPLQGEAFYLPHTPPLALQVAWKLHQTLVRPRFKDLFDLLHLVRHPSFNETTRERALEALKKECRADNTDFGRLRWLLTGNLQPLYGTPTAEALWQAWRHNSSAFVPSQFYEQRAVHITDAKQLPETLAGFEQQLQKSFQHAGFDAVLEQLPAPGANNKKNSSSEKRGFFNSLLDFFS
ncbi:nucleotidyl transferase AbiEii/AbiGii toxin family protein [Hymenobacter sp. BT664]|uniref:Nucleotidyl transferase AbiEii/AbiGii toxin family protein n=1 Tax=Hymenobacter montanus TaxID=2771359 RepID=A0A927GKE1_9BACT|nr:nucleotidyl transferase AbiEii/AbiGii toxin family protein [Hymenobacter montanus]MBD2769467.1 nucleotidyl transferase AbiEii/AbiGii toxin family protein [Hymenobacter montanus]